MPNAMSLTRGSEQARPCTLQARHGISRTSAPANQNAFQPEVDAPAFLGQALAQTDEQKRRADADRAGQQREQKGAQVDISHGVSLLYHRPVQAASSA